MATLKATKVVVLGGTSGIGLSTARAAAAEGASVVVASSRAESVKEAVAAIGHGATGHVANLADEGSVKGLFETIGPLDHLVYTAGETLTLGNLVELDLTTARKAFDVRLYGAMTAAKYAAPRIRKGGSIVFTLGTASYRPMAGWTVAASILGAVESFARALAVELAPVRVNSVCPGLVRTPLWKDVPAPQRDAMFEEYGKKLLVGRIGEPDELAEAYLYMMKNGFTTGQTLVVDGGGTLV